jgi:methylphosphotriester-DNA--protein-cysteine methyltransferase
VTFVLKGFDFVIAIPQTRIFCENACGASLFTGHQTLIFSATTRAKE